MQLQKLQEFIMKEPEFLPLEQGSN